jgi:hypothetical protein
MDKAQLKRKIGAKETKVESYSFVDKENGNVLSNQPQKESFNSPKKTLKAITTQEETKEDSSGQKTAHLANSVKQNNVSVKSSNSVDQTTSLTATPDGWKKVIEDIMPKTAKTATSRALIGGTATPKKSEDLHKSLYTAIKTDEEIANKVGDLLRSSLNDYYNDNYKNRLISKVKGILNSGFQVNMGGDKRSFPNIHNHQDGTKAALHATVCNTCYKAEKIKCKSCGNQEPYKGETLKGRIHMRNESFGKNGLINHIMTVNIKDSNKQLNGKDKGLHIKLLQWIPKDVAATLNKILSNGDHNIDIKFDQEPVYTPNFYQTFNQNYDHNKIK